MNKILVVVVVVRRAGHLNNFFKCPEYARGGMFAPGIDSHIKGLMPVSYFVRELLNFDQISYYNIINYNFFLPFFLSFVLFPFM